MILKYKPESFPFQLKRYLARLKIKDSQKDVTFSSNILRYLIRDAGIRIFFFFIIIQLFFLLIFVDKILLIANKIFSELHGPKKNKLFLVFLI